LTAVYTPSAGEISAGTVTLTLTTDDPTGPCVAVSDTMTITINPAATANAGPDQTICAGSNVTLAGSVGGSASSGTWSGGAGTFNPNTTTLTAVYTPSAGEVTAGTVTLTLTTNDPTGPCGAASDTMTITINPGATASAGADQTVCASSPAVTLAGSIGGSASNGTWSGGAGTFNPNNTTLTAVYTPSAGEISAGMVTLTLTTNDPTGPCGAVSDSVTLLITPLATANAGPDQTICGGSTVTLAGLVGGSASSGTWSGGGGTFTPNATTLTAVYTPTAGEVSAGTVTLTLTTNDPAGPCGAVNDTVTITINPPATVSAGPDLSACTVNPAVTLGGSIGGGASSGTWSGGSGTFTPNNTTLTASYTPSPAEVTAGSVTLTLTTDDPAGLCGPASDTVTITIGSCLELLVADTSNNRIQGYDGTTWSVIGVGTVGSGAGQFRLPEAVAFDATGRIYVADTGNNRIQWSTDGGTTWADFATNGTGTNQVKAPQGLILDSAGNLYVADTGNGRVMRFAGGTPGAGFVIATNGTASGQVTKPVGLAIDGTFRLFVTDESTSRVLRILNANTTVSGTSATIIATVGTALNKVQNPQGVAIDSNGILYVADTGNSRILRWVNANPSNSTTLALSGINLGQVNRPEGVTVTTFTTGSLAGTPLLIVGDTSNNRIVGRPIGTGGWSLIGAPNGTGSGTGQFRAPSKIQ
ncbi:MAG TPA: hypothetical protein PLB32_05225, partial [Acidobacteriota bacterium]|nr:hypothetical protein [Acidobacteriota bacterium]